MIARASQHGLCRGNQEPVRQYGDFVDTKERVMLTMIHLDGFKYGCMCGTVVDIGRKFTEDEQEWTVCNECASELLDIMLDPQRLDVIGKMLTPVKNMVMPKLGQWHEGDGT